MKIFQIAQRRNIGHQRIKPIDKKWLLNGRVLFGLFLFAHSILSQLMYIFCVASGFVEYVVCISVTSSSFLAFIGCATIAYKRKQHYLNALTMWKNLSTHVRAIFKL